MKGDATMMSYKTSIKNAAYAPLALSNIILVFLKEFVHKYSC